MVWFGLEDEEYDRVYTDRNLLKRIAKYLKKNYRRTIFVIVFLTMASILNGLIPTLSTQMLKTMEAAGGWTNILIILIVTFLFNFLGWGLNYLRTVNSAKIVGDLLLQMQEDAIDAVLRQDLSFFDKYPTGKVVSRVASDSNSFGEMTDIFIEAVAGLIVCLFVIIPMFWTNLTLGLIFLVMVPIVFGFTLSFRKIARQKTMLGQRSLALVNSFVQESISGIQVAKSFRQETKLFEQFQKINKQSYTINLQRALILNFLFPILNLIQGATLTVIFYIGGSNILQGIGDPADVYLFIQSLSVVFFPLFSVAAFWPQFQSGLSAAERIFALIDSPTTVVQTNNLPAPHFRGEIKFDQMTFEYMPGKPVFKDFSLHIQPGESVAIVGHTGAGKSSIAKLIARFYEFQKGDIQVDGKSIRDYDLAEYRRNIGFIPQIPFLWADTVENNVKYARHSASREEVNKALDQAGGADWVDDLSEGLETNIRERGNLLSMGQRQLVVFARMLLQDPAILILDEATASVDPFTETRIQEAMERTIKGRTSIIIAHRLWTVRHVDRIIVLDHGQVVEEGNHENLIAKGGVYANLYNTYFRHQSFEYIEQAGKQIVDVSGSKSLP